MPQAFMKAMTGASLANPLWLISVPKEISHAREEHKSVAKALGSSFLRNNWQSLLFLGTKHPFLYQLELSALMMLPNAVSPVITGINDRINTMRRVTTPFSQRFEHSDWSLRSQQMGLQSISQGQGFIGSEAGMFAAKYGRK